MRHDHDVERHAGNIDLPLLMLVAFDADDGRASSQRTVTFEPNCTASRELFHLSVLLVKEADPLLGGWPGASKGLDRRCGSAGTSL